jgi:drug/metabolite transporter (DMT)-like permease
MTGPFFAIFAAVLFGISSPFAKGLLGEIDPWLLAGLLYFGSGIGMAIVFLIRKVIAPETAIPEIKKNEIPWILGLALFGGVLGPVFLMYGLTYSTASAASLLLNLEGVLTACLAWIVFKEHFDRRIILGMISIILGGMILSWSGDFSIQTYLGPFLILGACLSWAIDNNLTRKVSLNDPILLTMIKSFVAGSTNLVLAISFGAKIPSVFLIFQGGALGFLCYGLSIVCFILALRNLGASRTGAYFSAAPFVGAVVAIFIWDEPITLKLVASAIFMAFGIYLHISESHEHEHTHEELEHEHSHTHDEHHQHQHLDGATIKGRHSHRHRHEKLTHRHKHFPDMHHNHTH